MERGPEASVRQARSLVTRQDGQVRTLTISLLKAEAQACPDRRV
jgi:hypothetical protein